MKTKILAATLLLSLGFNLAVIATFGHHRIEKKEFGQHRKGGAWHIKNLRKQLNLTDEQAAFMARNREELKKEIEPVRAELEKKRGELFALIDAGKADDAALDKRIGDIALLQARIEKIVVRNSLVVRGQLTPDQQARFKECMKKGKGPGKWHRKPGPLDGK